MKFALIAENRGVCSLNTMCKLLGVLPSSYYAWKSRVPSNHELTDEMLRAEIRKSYEGSGGTYGGRRIRQDLREKGIRCSLRRVRRLMREQALVARPKKKSLPKDHGKRSVIAPNRLNRNFNVDAPNHAWVGDFTYIQTQEGWLFVAVIMDLFSRRIVGWSMKETMTADLVSDALMMAVSRREHPVGLIHHSDQGSQYSSAAFQSLLKSLGIICSMSRAGDPWDNAAMESFFSSLKAEKIRGKVYRTRKEARQDVFEYIECFYNLKRRHSTLGYISPVEYESKYPGT